MNTTLKQIREHNPCEDSWKKLLASLNKTQADDEDLPLRYILDTLGVEDAIWSLRSLEGVDREIRLFTCDCAERSLPIYEAKHPNDMRPRTVIGVARRYANGEATAEELTTARDAAWDARTTWDAAWDATWDAAGAAALAARDAAWDARTTWDAALAAALAARAARAAAWAAARGTEKEAQKELFIKHFCK